MTFTFTDKQQYREQKFDQYFFKIVNDIFASILLALPFILLLCNENECFPVKVCGLAITHLQQDESYDILQYKHFEWQRYINLLELLQAGGIVFKTLTVNRSAES